MIKAEEKIVMRAIALCFKPYLKQEEAMIYTNLGRTQFALRADEAGVYKNENGYYCREELDIMCKGRLDSNVRYSESLIANVKAGRIK